MDKHKITSLISNIGRRKGLSPEKAFEKGADIADYIKQGVDQGHIKDVREDKQTGGVLVDFNFN